MATAAEVRRLERRVNDLITRAGVAEDAASRAMLREVDAFRVDLRDLIGSDRTFADLAKRIDSRASTLRTTLERITDTAITDAAEAGLELVDAPLTDAAVDLGPRTALRVADLAEDHHLHARNLIRDHTARIGDKSRALALRARAVPDGIPSALKAVGDALTDPHTILRGPANYLAAAARTTTATATSDASHQRMLELDAHIPDLRKRWVVGSVRKGHRAGHRTIAATTAAGIPLDRPYRVGGFAVQYPRDAALPPREVVNCRCHSVVHLTT